MTSLGRLLPSSVKSAAAPAPVAAAARRTPSAAASPSPLKAKPASSIPRLPVKPAAATAAPARESTSVLDDLGLDQEDEEEMVESPRVATGKKAAPVKAPVAVALRKASVPVAAPVHVAMPIAPASPAPAPVVAPIAPLPPIPVAEPVVVVVAPVPAPAPVAEDSNDEVMGEEPIAPAAAPVAEEPAAAVADDEEMDVDDNDVIEPEAQHAAVEEEKKEEPAEAEIPVVAAKAKPKPKPKPKGKVVTVPDGTAIGSKKLQPKPKIKFAAKGVKAKAPIKDEKPPLAKTTAKKRHPVKSTIGKRHARSHKPHGFAPGTLKQFPPTRGIFFVKRGVATHLNSILIALSKVYLDKATQFAKSRDAKTLCERDLVRAAELASHTVYYSDSRKL